MWGQLSAHWGFVTLVPDNSDNCWTFVDNIICQDQVWSRMSVIRYLLLRKFGNLRINLDEPRLILSFRKLCEDEGIVFQAYASLGAGSLGLLDHQTVLDVAKKYNVTPAQV